MAESVGPNLEAYSLLYQIENYLREVIICISIILDGKPFSASRHEALIVCPLSIKSHIDKVKRSDKKKRRFVPRVDNDIYFTEWNHLVKLFVENWESISEFSRTDLTSLKGNLETVDMYRNRIAHGSMFDDADLREWTNCVITVINIFTISYSIK